MTTTNSLNIYVHVHSSILTSVLNQQTQYCNIKLPQCYYTVLIFDVIMILTRFNKGHPFPLIRSFLVIAGHIMPGPLSLLAVVLSSIERLGKT